MLFTNKLYAWHLEIRFTSCTRYAWTITIQIQATSLFVSFLRIFQSLRSYEMTDTRWICQLNETKSTELKTRRNSIVVLIGFPRCSASRCVLPRSCFNQKRTLSMQIDARLRSFSARSSRALSLLFDTSILMRPSVSRRAAQIFRCRVVWR